MDKLPINSPLSLLNLLPKKRALLMEKVRRNKTVEVDEDSESGCVSFAEEEKKKGVGGGRRGGWVSPPSCQAQNCGADLTDAKRYHCRHKVCEFHSKAPAVLVAGLSQRFCQQCSRFHDLGEFDEAKRSCRRQLAGHNERRRKVNPKAVNEGSKSQHHPKETTQCRIAD